MAKRAKSVSFESDSDYSADDSRPALTGLQLLQLAQSADTPDVQLQVEVETLVDNHLFIAPHRHLIKYFVKALIELFKRHPSEELSVQLLNLVNLFSQRKVLTAVPEDDFQELVRLIVPLTGFLSSRLAATAILNLWLGFPEEVAEALLSRDSKVSPYVANAVLPRLLSGEVDISSKSAIGKVAELMTIALTDVPAEPLTLVEEHRRKLPRKVRKALHAKLFNPSETPEKTPTPPHATTSGETISNVLSLPLPRPLLTTTIEEVAYKQSPRRTPTIKSDLTPAKRLGLMLRSGVLPAKRHKPSASQKRPKMTFAELMERAKLVPPTLDNSPFSEITYDEDSDDDALNR